MVLISYGSSQYGAQLWDKLYDLIFWIRVSALTAASDLNSSFFFKEYLLSFYNVHDQQSDSLIVWGAVQPLGRGPYIKQRNLVMLYKEQGTSI